jgi:glycerol-3-phosphate O-acyltransferase/dihydroxyacetone phosphate acyltransferase
MKLLEKCLRGAVGALLRVLLGIYFHRIETFHPERVPLTSPLLFTSNHPGSVTDAFIIGTSVPRQVHFVATVQLFKFRPLAWLLKQCGIIPINRVKDDPRAMRSVMNTFEACFRVLEPGGAIGIFPEGITYDDSQLKTVKTGAARMALELENRHAAKLGLKIVPVGLTYSAKERYRSEVLAHFGEPIRVAEFIGGYGERRKEAINDLNAEIERRIQALILHLPKLEEARVVEAVKRLYLDRLKLGNEIIKEPVSAQAEELVLTQAIHNAVTYVNRDQPERFAAFVRKLNHYERWLRRLKLSDETVRRFAAAGSLARSSMVWAFVAVAGFPVALYGWLHRLIPAALVSWVANRFTDAHARKAQAPHVSMLTGLVGFSLCYAVYVWLVHRWFGWPMSLWYAVSLPVAGLIAHYYLRGMIRLCDACRTVAVLFRVPFARRRLLSLRSGLIAEIEDARREYRRARQSETGVAPAPA